MTVTLVISADIANQLKEAARNELETAGVLSIRVVKHGSDVRLLARKMTWAVEESYLERKADALSMAPSAYIGALAEAETSGEACIWVHTHPGEDGIPVPSVWDKKVDVKISDLFKHRTGSEAYGTLIVSPRAATIAFTGRLELQGADSAPIDRAWIVGSRLELILSFDSAAPSISDAFDRNVRALGAAVQRALSSLHVGIIGCGGTGSAVAEQLCRLGVRHFTLFDPDSLSDSNVTRVYGSFPSEVGHAKVGVMARHLLNISPNARCKTVPSMITVQAAAKELIPCDIIFGCTDDNAGRLVLSRFSTYFLTPVFDCGVLVSADAKGQLTGINARVTILHPGAACLVCRGRIDLQRAGVELMTPDERKRLENEGYAPALGRVEPAVVPFTTMVAATVTSELLERFIGYGPNFRPSEILFRIHDREISTNSAEPREGHYCHPGAEKMALGLTEPFLEQLWSM